MVDVDVVKAVVYLSIVIMVDAAIERDRDTLGNWISRRQRRGKKK